MRKYTLLGILLSILSYTLVAQTCVEVCAGDRFFHGYNAGDSNLMGGGQYNTFVGPFAGTDNEDGTQNSFFGQAAGASNNSGSYNSFFGYNAGFENTSATRNSFFGHKAGEETTTGGQNSFFGQESGSKNTTGSHNSFFGQFSGKENTTGYNNCYFGINAGGENKTAHSSSYYGVGAGRNANASYNSFFGQGAGNKTTSGHHNSFFGRWAGYKNTTGFENTYVGTFAGRHLKGSGNVCIGYEAGPAEEDSIASNKLYIGNSFGSPLIYGEFDNQKVVIYGEIEVMGSVFNGSSVHIKEDLKEADEANILSQLKQLPITEWSYKEKPDIRHIGPMAQDFYAAFGLGKDETTISTIDADGVSLAAIQALAKNADIHEKKITALEKENQQLEKTVQMLIDRMSKMEEEITSLKE